jgi:hypothetical protein
LGYTAVYCLVRDRASSTCILFQEVHLEMLHVALKGDTALPLSRQRRDNKDENWPENRNLRTFPCPDVYPLATLPEI